MTPMCHGQADVYWVFLAWAVAVVAEMLAAVEPEPEEAAAVWQRLAD